MNLPQPLQLTMRIFQPSTEQLQSWIIHSTPRQV